MGNRHFQPGTFFALLLLYIVTTAIGWGLAEALRADCRADREAHRTAVPAPPITAAPLPPTLIEIGEN